MTYISAVELTRLVMALSVAGSALLGCYLWAWGPVVRAAYSEPSALVHGAVPEANAGTLSRPCSLCYLVLLWDWARGGLGRARGRVALERVRIALSLPGSHE